MTKLITAMVGLILLPLVAVTTVVEAETARERNAFRTKAFHIDPIRIAPLDGSSTRRGQHGDSSK